MSDSRCHEENALINQQFYRPDFVFDFVAKTYKEKTRCGINFLIRRNCSAIRSDFQNNKITNFFSL